MQCRFHSKFRNALNLKTSTSEHPVKSANFPAFTSDSISDWGAAVGGDRAGNPSKSTTGRLNLYYENGWQDGITAPINQRCALDNLIHFSRCCSHVLARTELLSAGTKLAINLSCPLPHSSLATSPEPSSIFHIETGLIPGHSSQVML